MNVSLTPALEAYVRRKIETGLYGSASEVVREALRLMSEQDLLREAKLEELRQALAPGLEHLDRGEGRPLDEKTIDRIKARGRQRRDRA